MENREAELIKEKLKLDAALQHLRHYQEGYREGMLTLLHGEDIVWGVFGIDVARYAPDSARKFSYNEGWNAAVNDYNRY